jgi:AcrR family transcriptional regulator
MPGTTVAQRPESGRRQQLLNALIEEFATGGIGDRSLRQVSESVGTSHRMLLHHFKSRDELMLSVVEEIERRQRTVLETMPMTPAEGFAAMWDDVRRPELRSFERLFFECYSRAAHGEEPFARMVPGAVDDWLSDVDAATSGTADRASARLGLAVVRGLLLDLTATGDDEGVDAAARVFIDLLKSRGVNGP